MKFFTKDWYGRMQAVSSLVFNEDEKFLQEIKQHYASQGRNMVEEYKRSFEESLPNLQRYLPAHLIELMDGGRLHCSIPSAEAAAQLRKYHQEWRGEMERLDHAYRMHFETVKPLLPPGVRGMLDVYAFHDARVLSLEEPETGIVRMKLDCKSCFLFQGICTVTFHGVTEFVHPEEPSGYWLYEEYDIPGPGSFELGVLLSSDRKREQVELRIAARDVEVSRAAEGDRPHYKGVHFS